MPTTTRPAARPPTPTLAADLPPLFGERATQERLCQFRLMSYGSNGEQEHLFTARAEIDAATVLSISRPGGLSAQAAAMERLLVRILVDDDGIPHREKPVPALDDEELTRAQLAVYDGDWEIDGKTFPTEELALEHARENGSSLRRFSALLDDPYATVQFEALQQIVNYVMEQAGQRPLAPSKPSSRPPTRKRR